MVDIPISSLVSMAVFALVALVTFVLMFTQKRKAKLGKQTKVGHFFEDVFMGVGVVSTWLLTMRLIALIENKPATGESTVSVPQTVPIFGLNIDTIALIVSGVVLVMALFFLFVRVVFVPWLKSKDPTDQSLIVMIAQQIYRRSERKQQKREEKLAAKLAARAEAQGEKKSKSQKFTKTKLFRFGVIAIVWFLLARLLEAILGGGKSSGFKVDIFPPRTVVWGMDVSVTTVTMWVVMGVLIVLALLARFFVVPRFRDIPKGTQNVLELMIESVKNYTDDKVPHMSDNLAAYILTVAALLVGCSMVELMGVRAPSADIMMTFALSLCTFFLVNYYGIKGKKLMGYILSYAKPSPIVFPIRIIAELAIPISLASRLFGNMLAGLIVMELLYTSLGSNAIGIASVAGLFFNVFHPLLQAFIFVTLTLTYINEAVE